MLRWAHMQGIIHIGILGGGQLGRMLLQSSMNFPVHISVLDPDEHAPCRAICADFVLGDFRDYDTVLSFGEGKDILTIEIEQVNVEALKELSRRGVDVFPRPEHLELIQDKGEQKAFFARNTIPTADFVLVGSREEMADHAHLLPAVCKARQGGYDGKGVHILRSEADIKKAFDSPCVLEHRVDIEKELSVIVARNTRGEVAVYPVVEMVFDPELNLVTQLFAPANITPEQEQKAVELATTLAGDMQFVGLLAVEMFLERGSGRILINELAPRPHNSGHHTIEANVTSQFEQHLRAICGWPLGSTALRSPAVMLNVLGEPGHSGAVECEGLESLLGEEDVHLHWYGKNTTRPGRKMGHITVLGSTVKQARKKADHVQGTLRVGTGSK